MKKSIYTALFITLLLQSQLFSESKNNFAIIAGIGQLNLEYKINSLMSVEALGSYILSSTSTVGSTTIESSYYSYGARINLFSSDPLNSDWWLSARAYMSAFYRQYHYDISSPDSTIKYLDQKGIIFGVRALALNRVYVDLGAGIGSATGSYFDYLESKGMDLGSLIYQIFYSIPIDIRIGFTF